MLTPLRDGGGPSSWSCCSNLADLRDWRWLSQLRKMSGGAAAAVSAASRSSWKSSWTSSSIFTFGRSGQLHHDQFLCRCFKLMGFNVVFLRCPRLLLFLFLLLLLLFVSSECRRSVLMFRINSTQLAVWRWQIHNRVIRHLWGDESSIRHPGVKGQSGNPRRWWHKRRCKECKRFESVRRWKSREFHLGTEGAELPWD